MSNRDSRYSDYPRRGRYGDPTPRCAWCGRPTDFGTRCCVGGAFYRYYCSYSCRAAGDLYVNVACGTFTLVLPFVLYMIIAPTLPSFVNPLELFLPILFLFAIGSLCVWGFACVGYNERRKEKHNSEYHAY